MLLYFYRNFSRFPAASPLGHRVTLTTHLLTISIHSIYLHNTKDQLASNQRQQITVVVPSIFTMESFAEAFARLVY